MWTADGSPPDVEMAGVWRGSLAVTSLLESASFGRYPMTGSFTLTVLVDSVVSGDGSAGESDIGYLADEIMHTLRGRGSANNSAHVCGHRPRPYHRRPHL